MSGPLEGVRVIDLTAVLMGPFATQTLGDYGADVIKVEPPAGDTTRWLVPVKNAGMAAPFLHVNRNKRALVLDLKAPAGLEALFRLVKTADVLIYNVRPQAMARLGLTWEALSAVNPRLIYVGVFGYGQDGPYAAKPAYDDLIQGALAIPSMVATVGDGVPRYVPVAMIDRTVGLAAVGAVSAALYRREKTGVGQAIDVPMFETMVPFALGEHMAGQTYEPPTGPPGYPRMLSRGRAPFATSDGYVCGLIYNDKQWRSFFRFLGRESEFDADPRLATIGARTRHSDELYAMVAEIMRTRSTEEWLRFFDEADIPSMRLNTLDTLMDDPHLSAIGFFESHVHPTEGPIKQMRPTSKWSESPLSVRRLAPRLGEHSAEVLGELGYSPAEITALADAGVTRVDQA